MIKKCFLVLLTAALMMSSHVWAQNTYPTVVVNDVTYRIETDGTATVVRHVDGQNATGTLTLVDSVDYSGTRYPVKAIGTEAFQFCSQLTGNLVIPNTVTTIGGSAFFSCSGFTGTLSLPTGLTTVGLRAFYDCSGLTGNLVIPNTVTTLGNFAFHGCSGLNGSLTLSNNLTSIGTGIFMECNGLSGVLTIPEGVTSIDERAFYGCSSFTQLVLPNSLNTIGKEAFIDCTGLTGLALPYNLLSVGEAAFKNCSSLSGDLVFSNKTTTIGKDAFRGCTGLNGELVLGRAMTSIGKNAFYGPTFSSVTCLSLNPPQSESTVPVFSPFPPVVYIPCGSAYNTQIWAGLNCVQMCYLTASPNPFAMGDCPAGAWKRPFRFTLTNSLSSPMNILGATIEGATWDLVTLDLGSYTLPISVGAGDSVTLGLSRANDYGSVSGKVHVQYTTGRDTLDSYIRLTARFFTPIDGDVWELARPINTYPYSEQINGSSLHNTYFLPCSNIPDGKNMVYKLVLTQDKLLDASVTGENGKVAVYAAEFGGLGGPDVSNCLNSVRTDGTIVGHWLRPGTYYLVASSTASSFSLSVNTSALPCPEAPTIVSPANYATNVSLDTKTLRWSFGNYTTQYRLEFGADASNLQTLVDWTDSLRTEYTLTDSLDYSTCYTWKVSTRNVDCQDSTYAYGRFYTPILAPNELNSLEAGKLMSGETLHLTWNAPSAYRNETPSLYNVYVRTSSFDSFSLVGNAAETEYERTGIEFSGTGDYNQYEYAVTAVYDLAGGEMVESPLSATHVVQVYNAATATGHVYKSGTTTGIAGATLTFTQGARNYVFTTDANGAWSGSLPVNTFPIGKVAVSAPGYRDTTNLAPVPVVAGITNVLDCELEEIILGPYNVTVTAKPLAGGAVFGAGVYQNGDTCTLSVSSYRGYYLSYWALGDSTVSTDSVYSFVVREDADYTAHFDRFPYQITAQADPADYGTVEGAGTYKHFDAATLLAKPNQGYMFVRWTLNGEEVSNTAMYSFLVTGPAEYVAHFTVFNALEDVKGETSTQKILRDDKLYILRGERVYDAMGRELKMGN
ncbi:MAG: leucine-rich repeat protein [Paludibacteraceae bacterium]|nr:leucine-rich repeat protein [Paludibacteraceae bacterium]